MLPSILLRCIYLALATLLSAARLRAQAPPPSFPTENPLKITLFTESIGLPNFGRFGQRSGYGIRIGTEFYYRRNTRPSFFQTLNLGVYRHRDLQTGFFLTTEGGYRKHIGHWFADATLGGGLLLAHTALPRYKTRGDTYTEVKKPILRALPTIGLGTGYRLGKASLLARYEVSGEMPFGYKGVPALPHQSFHLGTQVPF